MNRPQALADAATAIVRDQPGAHTMVLARALEVEASAIEWALYRCGRSLGVGQDAAGCWWHHDDSPEILGRLRASLPPSLEPLDAEPEWS